MSINEVRYLPECGSTNAYVKEHFEELGPVGAVYTENQTAGRGRLGRSWVNAEGKALYYTAAIREPLAQPATLPLLASLAVRTQLKLRYGVDCQIKWPNDLLLNGKKIVGILCESVSYGYQQQGRGILCGIGINLAQPQSYFDAAGLPNGTSLALQGSILGPILFLLVFNVPHYIIRYVLTFVGYRFGSDMISKVQESGIMDTIVKMASIMGAMVIGAMTMEMVTVDIPLMVGAGDGAQTLAELLNGIFPGFVTMGMFGIGYLMLKKKMNPLLIMLVILLASIAGAFFGVLGVQ